MLDELPGTYTGFLGVHLIARGRLTQVALAIKERLDEGAKQPPMVFEDETGRSIELDLRGSADDVRARLAAIDIHPQAAESSKRTGPGRPKLGVVSREISLLPRHWEWLNEQPGGASVALRKLVEEARRQNQGKDRLRKAQEALYKFMYLMAGNLPGFEEASRVFYAKDYPRFLQMIQSWPTDVRDHLKRLLEIYLECERAMLTEATV